MEKSLVLRTCKADLTSRNGFQWAGVGGITTAPDWNNNSECGNGLHGWLYGAGDHSCSNYLGAGSIWMVLEVVTSEIIMLDGKCKFPEAKTVFCGDRKSAAEYLLGNEPRSVNVPIIGRTVETGDKGSLVGGALSVMTGGDGSTLTGGDDSTLTGGYDSTLTGGNRSTLTGGDGSTLTGGDDSALTGGYDSTLTGGALSVMTGGYGSALTGGHDSTLTGGNRSTLTGGDDSTLTGGDDSTLTGGNRSTLTGGDDSTLTGGYDSTLTGGYGSTLTGGDGSELRIRFLDSKANRYRTVIAYVGENGIQPNTPYKLNENHEFEEVKP